MFFVHVPFGAYVALSTQVCSTVAAVSWGSFRDACCAWAQSFCPDFPNLRARGVDYDVRLHSPYSSYEDFDFIVPVGQTGDNYDRFLVREEEMWQSLSIIEQAYRKVQEFKGAEAEVFHADIPEYYLPEKEDVYTKMEALIWHFKIIMGETEIPKGEVYNSVEGANGELGFYLVSDGGRTPYRLHFRRPCFIYYQAYSELTKGAMLSDAVITMSSLNLIAGELDA